MTKRTRRIPGISVYARGKTWAYRLDIEPDPLTGDRRRENRAGFDSEDAAWDAALKSKATHDRGRHVKPSARKVEAFMTEWLTTVRDALKSSAYQNYVDYTNSYLVPTIGNRRLQDITVPVLNEFYRHLLNSGRRKPDNNSIMYEYWERNREKRNGLGPTPTELSKACSTTIHAAKAAVLRYRRGRVAIATGPGLAPKTVKNVHRLLHRALKDAVAWDYLMLNPAEHASVPRQGRANRSRVQPWTIEELAAWLTVAMQDRFAGMWVLEATTGMRRSELAGAERDLLKLDRGNLILRDTRIVVAGQAEDSDGKSESSNREISLDTFTVASLRLYVTMLDAEREAFGKDYPTHGKLMCSEDGTALHPDTITRRFNRLVDKAGVRRIRLHDVRHTYATMSLDEGINPKIVSDRIGHASMNVTQQIYTHHSTGRDGGAAEQIGLMIQQAVKAAGGSTEDDNAA